MIKKILTASLFSAMILLSGCGDSEGEERLAIQQMLDDGDYVGVISAVEPTADSSEDYIALGAAYMGKAGLSLTDILTALAAASDNGGDSFAEFVSSVANSSTSTALTDLGMSGDYYKKVVAGACTDNFLTLSDSQKDICLFIGLGATTKATVAINHLVGDISTFTDNTKIDDKLTASACAMQYAFDGRSNSNVNAACTNFIEEVPDVNFTVINKVYTPLAITVDGNEYYHLMTSINQTVLTKGYCTRDDFSTRVDTYDAALAPYACPINEDPSAVDLTVATVLVNVLNEGMDSIGAALSEEIQADIDEFKTEITGDVNGTITEQNIIDYLNTQNSL